MHFQVHSAMQLKASAIKPRSKRDMGPLLSFDELMNDIPEEEFSREDEDSKSNTSDDYKLPDPCALLHITNRRKLPLGKKSLSAVRNLALSFTLSLHIFY